MGQGVAEVLTFAIGVAISAMAVIAVILMLFSQRARLPSRSSTTWSAASTPRRSWTR